MEAARNNVLVHVDAQWAEILPHIYARKIKWPGEQIRLFLDNQHFTFWKMMIFSDNNIPAILTHGDIIAVNIYGVGYHI